MKVRAFITHKLCEQYADCQDRFCINPDNRRIGLSDGMSQSIFPSYWAELLSKQYANEGHCNDDDRIKLCASWLQRVNQYREEQISIGKDPWRLDNFIAARKGAGATICGVNFENATDWKGDVLGDSCIVKVNTKEFKLEILTSEDKAFDSFPDFYDSFPEKKGRGTIKSFEGRIGSDDILLLVSDPFSEFFTENKDNVKDLVEQILMLNNHDDYCKLVDNWRAKGMHNDDSTLCVVEFDNDIALNIQYQDFVDELIENEKFVNNNEETQVETSEEDLNAEESNKNETNQAADNSKEEIVDESVNNGSEGTFAVEGNVTNNAFIEEKCLNDIIEETRNWILGKINELLKCSKTTNASGRYGKKMVVNKTIPTSKVEKLREEIETFINQLIKK